MNRTVFITGASSGIGRASVKYFQKKGWNVAATMRNPDQENELGKFQRIICPRLDVTNVESIHQAIEETKQKFGRIDAIVNNAGYGLVGPFEASTPEQIHRQVATNLIGVMNVIREILPHFREQKSGVIANISSYGGRITFPLYSLYHATKWGLEGFSESLQFELKPFNIRVKLIEPGPIKTDFYHRSMDLTKKPGLTAYDDFVNRAMPNMQREGDQGAAPDQVAQVIYGAVTDNTWKLRYPTDFNAGFALLMRKIFPESWFRRVVELVVMR